MQINQPPPRITLTVNEVLEAVQTYVDRRVSDKPVVDGLVATDLADYRVIGSHDVVLQGSLTFTLKPESQA